MDVHITALDIVVRLGLTAVAGALLGLNRSQKGRAAGLRTTMLIGLAAAVSMVLANLMLGTDQEGPAGYVRMDVMRLPLGVLSGIGFIGAGAIVRRADLVQGVTTAAMLWLMTMIGLSFGAGYLWLGAGVTAGAFVIMWGLKFAEALIAQDHRAVVIVSSLDDSLPEPELRRLITDAGLRVLAWAAAHVDQGRRHDVHCDVTWRSRSNRVDPPPFLAELGRRPGVVRAEWKPNTPEATPH